MTEKLFTGTLNHNKNKTKLSVALEVSLSIMYISREATFALGTSLSFIKNEMFGLPGAGFGAAPLVYRAKLITYKVTY